MFEARVIHQSPHVNRHEIKYLITSIFMLELYKPSKEFWIVSPWIADLDILDNSLGNISSLVPSFDTKKISLTEYLKEISDCGTGVRIITRTKDKNNRTFLNNLRYRLGENKYNEIVNGAIELNDLHQKGLLTDNIAVKGSMNFTYRGMNINIEEITASVRQEDIEGTKLNFKHSFGVWYEK